MPTIEETKTFLSQLRDCAGAGTEHIGFSSDPDPRKRWDEYQNASQDPNFLSFICELYRSKASLLEAEDYEYPCSILPAPSSQVSNVNSILDQKLTDLPACEPVSEYHKAVLELTSHVGQNRANEAKFAMVQTTAEPLRISCGVGDYFAALDTCDVLKLEAQMAWVDSRGEIANDANPLGNLPLRARLHASCDNDPLHRSGTRCAAVAVSTLICYLDDSGYRCLLHRRSREKKLAADPDLFHVIPAAMFEPDPWDREEPYDVYENILREYLEEVYDIKKPEACPQDRNWYRSVDLVRELDEMIQDGKKASLYLTGLTINLLNLRPEICTLLVIRDLQWRDKSLFRRSKQQWEYDQDGATKVSIADSDTKILSRARGFVAPGKIVPPGAAAFWLGVRLARTVI